MRLIAAMTATSLRESWMLEARRLAAVGLKFYRKAIDDDDPQAAIVFIKASERRATLQGANHPIGHAVQVMHVSPKQTSTEHLRSVLDGVLGISVRERELKDRHDGYRGESLTADELAELEQLQAEREAKREQEVEAKR